MVDEQDQQLLDTTEAALKSAWRKYHLADDADQPLLEPQIRLAYSRWLDVHMKLLLPETLSEQSDIAEAQQIQKEIDAAADNQQLVTGIVKLAGLLSKFA